MSLVPHMSTLPLSDLRALEKEVQDAIKVAEAREMREALEAARAAAKSRGFDLDDIHAPSKTTPEKPAFTNPENPQETWSGKGRRPKWLNEALRQGKSLDSFKT